MAWNIDQRLAELGLLLPNAPAPAASYAPYVVNNGQAYISGQLPVTDGKVIYRGRVGEDLSLEDGNAAARLCGVNILAQLKTACDGNLGRVKGCIKLGGFVCAGANFTDHPKVINGASDLMRDVFGETGQHARFAVGCSSLPLGAAVEIEALFAIEAA